jgi:hypothetical protein
MLVRWRIVPVETPRVRRHCPRCGAPRWFRSSDAFRVNARQRRVDVWLIYRCGDCDATWNREVFTRALPRDIGAGLYHRLQHNDRETAWRMAFDVSTLVRLGVEVDADCPVMVERIGTGGHGETIALELAHPCHVRLDKLLAAELGWSRSRLRRAVERGEVRVEPGGAAALRRPARDGQVIRWCAPGRGAGASHGVG